jgi:hypothetical protein
MNNKNIDKFSLSSVLLLFLFLVFSSKLWEIFLDIIKSLFYIILIIFGVNLINPEFGNKIKNTIVNFISYDNDTIKNTITNVVSNITNQNKESIKKIIQENIQVDKPLNKPDDLKIIENRDIYNLTETNNRRLS